MNLAGKIVVVTGGAGGIGTCLNERLLAAGARVLSWDLNREALDASAAEAARFGRELFTDVVDVTRVDSLRDARDRAVEAHGRIDVWINNAGIAGMGGFLEQPEVLTRKVIDIDLNGVILGTRLALEYFEGRGGGVVVNMASCAGLIAAPYLVAYSTAKHGVVGFTRALREEMRLRDSPVRLVLVCPGFVDTAMIMRGKGIGFPEWLGWALSSPESAAREIVRGIEKGRDEIYPTRNGRAMLLVHRFFPRLTARSTRLLLVRKWKDLFLNRYSVD